MRRVVRNRPFQHYRRQRQLLRQEDVASWTYHTVNISPIISARIRTC